LSAEENRIVSRIVEEVGFVHLRIHSAYSLLEGALPLKRLIELARADRMPALGIADTGNLFGALEFSEKMVEKGIQPIIGCQVAVDFADIGEDGRAGAPARGRPLSDLVLIAATEPGYWNLVRLVSDSYTQGAADARAHVGIDALCERNDGLIVLTGGPGGPLNKALADGQAELAAARLDRLAGAFGDRLYVELQRHGTQAEQAAEPALVAMAYERGLALVATNEAFFPTRDDYDAHDALIAIAEGAVIAEGNRRRLTPEHYFKTRAEMMALFADLPEATESTVEIALRCAWWPRTRKPILPRFAEAGADPEEAERAEAAALRAAAAAGLTARLKAHGLAPGFTEEDYRQRLDYELGVIEKMKYPGYFMIVADFIHGRRGRASRSDRARLRRRIGGCLVADDHRSRSAAVLAAVRALPQSRPRVDAGLRRRFLPEPARRGDPVRPAEIRRRPGGADHHLRHAAGARRAARRRPRIADALRPGRPPRQDGAAEPGQPDDAGAGGGDRAAVAGGARQR
jgi:DNA polymerase-3 subunit alpha